MEPIAFLKSRLAIFVLAFSAPFARSEIQYGSGFFVQPDGYILTNQHVVEGAEVILVATSDGQKFPAEVARADEVKDLALLKIEKTNAPALPLSFSRPIRVLESVVAVGYPYADKLGLELSAYDGKVNAIRESGKIPLIQMDASVNHGSSGGPVLNERGEVIGITVAKLDAVRALIDEGDIPERMNFAIPIGEAKGVLSSAFPFGYKERKSPDPATPAEIFEYTKPAVVLVVAKTRDRETESTVPVRRAEAVETPPTIPPAVAELVEDFVQASNSDSRVDIGSFWAPTVNYMDQGPVSADYVRKDHAKHKDRWPIRSYRLKGSPTFTQRGETWLVEFVVEFAVESRTQKIKGEAADRLYVRPGNPPTIIGIQETVTHRERTKK